MPGLAAEYYQEARLCWYCGSFVASILMTQLSFEEALRAQYRVARGVRGSLTGGKKVDDAGFSDLLQEAKTDGLLNAKEFRSLDELRRLRNPYVHSKDVGGSDKRPDFSELTLKIKAPFLVSIGAEKEAERSIRTLVTLFPILCKRFWGLA